ncbi:MAG: ParB/RepB/Spo0J family partition protein [candidate division WOR-3 bacterium]|nr:MAG: ParB/RepB/Spo0J family partition protein [candidate division WOR-3 bacterium]
MRRRALGKGLESLIPTKEKEVFQEGYRMIPISLIKRNPYQPRAPIEESEIRDLVVSIKEKGVIEPIIVKRSGDGFVLAAGERRLKAARTAGLKEIPAVIRDLSEQELLEIGLIENLQRKDLNPIEEAQAYEQLSTRFKLTHDHIALLVGKDRSTVTNALRLLTLPRRVVEYLRKGKISAGHARALLGLNDEMQVLHIADRIVAEDLSVRQAEAIVRKLGKKPRITLAKSKEPNIVMLEEELSKLLRTKVSIEWKKNRGSIVIHCPSVNDFNRIYEYLKKARK